MRAIPEALAERLASGVTTLAHVWRITRRDESVFAFTDHDEPLLFDDLVCEPMVGLSAGATEKSIGLNVDTASIAGALASESIAEDDLARGLWDGASVDLYRVDWSEPALRVHLFAGASARYAGAHRRSKRNCAACKRNLTCRSDVCSRVSATLILAMGVVGKTLKTPSFGAKAW